MRYIEKINKNNLEEDLGLANLPVAMFPQHGPDPLLARPTQVLLINRAEEHNNTSAQYTIHNDGMVIMRGEAVRMIMR